MLPTREKSFQWRFSNQKKDCFLKIYLCIVFIGISMQAYSSMIQDTGGPLIDQLEVYPPLPNDLFKSERYTVSIKQGAIIENSYVHMDPNNFPLNTRSLMTDDNHWTSFSFEGHVEVTVTLPNRTTINSAQIRPKSYNINSVISGNTVTFRLTQASNVYLEIDGEEKHPIFIFANPMEVNPPLENGSNVIVFEPGTHDVSNRVNGDFSNKTLYFKPGVHNVGLSIDKLSTNSTVYIAGGAYVKGLLFGEVNKDHITIRGRGILSGIEYPWTPEWALHLIELPGSARQTDIQIEGITFTNAPKSSIITRGATTVDNIKMLLFGRNSDGVSSGANSVIKNSFFKVNDDVIKLFDSNITVYHNVIWHQPIAAIFQMSWKETNRVTNIEVFDIDVIHFDRNIGTYELFLNSALLACRNINGGSFDNINLHDIRLEHEPYQLLGLMMKDNRLTGFQDGLGSIDGISFSNIHMENKPRIKSFLNANGTQTGEINNINFCNIYEAGVKLTNVDDILNIENPSKTNNINISVFDFANAGPNQTLNCNGFSQLTLEAADIGEGYTYAWTTNDGNIIFGRNARLPTISGAGTYTLTVTDPSGYCSDTDTVVIKNNTTANFADAGPNQTLSCEASSEVTLQGIDSGTGYTYVWSTTDGNILSNAEAREVVVNQSGTYFLTVTNPSSGCSDTDTVIVDKIEIFSINAGEDKNLVCGETSVNIGLDTSLENQYSYSWETEDGHIVSGENSIIATVDKAGTYLLRAVDSSGCSDFDIVRVTESVSFSVDAGLDSFLTCPTPEVSLSGNNIFPIGYTFQWSTADGNILQGENESEAVVNAAGIYTLVITDPNGCIAEDTVEVFENIPLTLDLGDDIVLAENVTLLTLGDSVVNDPANQYAWETVDGNILSDTNLRLIEVDQAGTYILLVTNSETQCTITDEIVVTNELTVEGNDILMYPNPTDDSAILIDSSQSVKLLNFFDSKGSVALTWDVVLQGNEVNVSNLASGLYIVMYDILDENEEIVPRGFKIIIR